MNPFEAARGKLDDLWSPGDKPEEGFEKRNNKTLDELTELGTKLNIIQGSNSLYNRYNGYMFELTNTRYTGQSKGSVEDVRVKLVVDGNTTVNDLYNHMANIQAVNAREAFVARQDVQGVVLRAAINDEYSDMLDVIGRLDKVNKAFTEELRGIYKNIRDMLTQYAVDYDQQKLGYVASVNDSVWGFLKDLFKKENILSLGSGLAIVGGALVILIESIKMIAASVETDTSNKKSAVF